MHPIVVILLVFVSVCAFILLAALAATAILASVGIRQAAKERERDVRELLSCLPCTDCGSCGSDTCEAFAHRLLDTFSGTEACGYLAEAQQETVRALLKTRQEEWERRKEMSAQDQKNLRKKRFQRKTGGQKHA